jgi:hypothetical protein
MGRGEFMSYRPYPTYGNERIHVMQEYSIFIFNYFVDYVKLIKEWRILHV